MKLHLNNSLLKNPSIYENCKKQNKFVFLSNPIFLNIKGKVKRVLILVKLELGLGDK
jgi:hypothetical protein